MATFRSITAASLRRIGVLAEGETPTASQMADALESGNALLDQWALERLQIPVVLRQRIALENGVGAYRLSPVTADAETYDGFDVTTWTTGPPGWTKVTTGAITVNRDTATFQSAPAAIQAGSASIGTLSLYRDIVCDAGFRCNVSLWMTGVLVNGSTGGLIVQNTNTGLYLNSDGTWGSTAVRVFDAPNNGGGTYAKSQLGFYLDPGAMLGDTLRFTISLNGIGGDVIFFDTFDFINYADLRERPVYVDQVNVIDTTANPTLEIPLDEATDSGFAQLRIKSLPSALPSGYYYNPTFPYGALTVWPVPNRSGLTLIVYAGYPITKFSSSTNAFYLPPGYERMVVTNLALELAPEYSVQPSPSLERQARDSIAAVKAGNFRMADLGFDAATLGNTGGWWDIRTGP